MTEEQLERAMNKWKVMKRRTPNASELRGQQAEPEDTDGIKKEMLGESND